MDLRAYSMRSTIGWLFALLLVLGACSSGASSEDLAASVDHAEGPATDPPPEATEILEEEIAALRGRLPQEAPLPIGWSRIPHDEAIFGVAWSGNEMWSVISGGPGLVAVGFSGGEDTLSGGERDAAVWTSLDGITWFRVPHDEAVFGGEGEQTMSSVTVGGPGLVAVGVDGSGYSPDWDAAVWTSVYGLVWSRVPHDESVFGGGEMRSVTVGGPGLVAVGQEGTGYTDETGPGRQDAAVWTSVDGITWTRAPNDESVFGGPSNQSMVSVTAGGPGLVAVGWDDTNAAVWTSVDGIIWSRVPHDESVFGRVGRPSMVSVTAGGPGLVAVGSDNSDAAVWTSIDGITWSRILDHQDVFGEPGLLRMTAVTATESSLVAVGFEKPVPLTGILASEEPQGDIATVWTSTDGITWTRVPHDQRAYGAPHGQEMLSVIAWGSGLVAVGHEGGGGVYHGGYGSLHAAVWVTTP